MFLTPLIPRFFCQKGLGCEAILGSCQPKCKLCLFNSGYTVTKMAVIMKFNTLTWNLFFSKQPW